MRLKREGDFIALQVWLPFISDTHNQGVSGDNNTVSAATFGSGGKIGGGYLSGGTITIPAATSKTFFNKTGMSFAFWLYPIGTSGSGAIMGQESMAQGDNRMYTIFQYPTPNDLHLSWQDNTANNTAFLGGVWTGFFPADTWTHFCVTFDGTNALIYRNGVQYGSVANRVTNRTSFEYNYPIRGSSRAKLNDVRIYDHCLSPKEVKEIAKGLVCHYTLSNTGNNLYTGSKTFSGTWVNSAYWSTDTETYNGFTVKYKNTVWGGLAQNIPCTNGDIFTISFYAKVQSGGKIISIHRSSLGNVITGLTLLGGNFSPTQYEWVTSTDDGTEWGRYWATVRIDSADITYLQWRIENSIADKTLYVCGMKLERGSTPTPWSPNSADAEYSAIGLNDAIEYDVSGYGHNGTKTGTITYEVDTPRYWTSSVFDGNNTLIKASDLNLHPMLGSEWTCAFWVYNKDGGDRSIFFSGYGFTTGASFGIEKTVGNGTRIYWAGSPDIYPTGYTVPVDQWCHLAFVGTPTSIKCYLNGVLKYTYTGTLNISTLAANTTYGIGRDNRTGATAFKGNMSDVRFYATCLSDADILALYNTPMSLSSNGTLMVGGELTEA